MKASVCVIGAGLGGGIAAATLAARGHPVTLVELGETPAPLNPADEVWDAAKVRVPFTRGSGVGGTSNLWHGGLTILDRTDVEGIDGGGRTTSIPIPYDELLTYYARALEVLHGSRISLQDIEARAGDLAGMFADQAAFRPKALVYPDRAFSTAPMIRLSQASHGLRLLCGIRVSHLVNANARRVRLAEGTNTGTGERVRIEADHFILAAGGLGSPKILLDSAVHWPALSRLPVGMSLVDHPTGYVFKARLKQRADLAPLFGTAGKGYRRRLGFVLRPEALGLADHRNHILYLRPAVSMKDPRLYEAVKNRLVAHRGSRLRGADILALMRHSDLLLDAVNFRYAIRSTTRHVSGFVFAEQWPDSASRMRALSHGGYSVSWGVSRPDRDSLEKFLVAFRHTYGHLFERFDLYPDVDARLDSAGHHSGGCRMAPDSTEGVVDADHRVRGVDNLSVADASALGSTGHANTGLTIAAMALRCCDVLAGKQPEP
jgi:choline dehydrogenase-like flavoprotein